MNLKENRLDRMNQLSADIRIQTIEMLGELGFGHIGGSASVADVLAVLYGGVMNVDASSPKDENRDWLVLSKGHCAPALYSALALRNFFPMEWLKTLNKPGTKLPSHADARTVPGIDMCTGSLGQGISCAAGICLTNRLKRRDNWTYCILGDGELNEGQVWEACEFASHYHLDHFICFVDWNKMQLDGPLERVMDPIDLEAKFTAFGFDVQTVKVYDVGEIYDGIMRAKKTRGKPHCIILDTYKGIGVQFAEEKMAYNHHLPCTKEECSQAIAEIHRRISAGTYPGGDKQW